MVKDSKIDKVLIVVTGLLLLFGLIMIYSTTSVLGKEEFGSNFHFLKKQLIWLLAGLVTAAAVALLHKPYYLAKPVVFTVITIVVIGLILVFFSGKINNSYRWIRLAGFSIQPSEFAKIAVVLYLSFVLSRDGTDVNDLKKLGVLLIPFFIIELLILKEPDLGTFFLILLIALGMLFVAGLKLRYFLAGSVFLVPAMYWIIKMNPEKMKRIMAFLNPEEYVSTYGFQALQSVYAVGSGGIFGKGLGNSTQKLYFLPYAYSDFIYAIVGEEAGLLGALTVIGLFLLFLIRGIHIAKYSGNRHTYLLVVGLTFLIVIQAMINISVTLGIFPTKGIPLPFISNGGSSLIASLIITGLILNVSRLRKTVLLND
ncbi:MAG: putative lipid II flippase FtsW [bacterium]|nr:putative lipid II flippase FtsW [bacterium]